MKVIALLLAAQKSSIKGGSSVYKYLSEVEPAFWMDGYLAHQPVAIAHSLEMLADPLDPEDLYVVFGTFEGEWEVLRFHEFLRNQSFAFSADAARERFGNTDVEVQWSSSMDQREYVQYVETIRSEIKAGWVYQVNACRLLSSETELDLPSLFFKIQASHPAPASGYFKNSRWEIASASPETFFRVKDANGSRLITASPIKGTSRDGRFKEKDAAENVMIVDLMRNDISPLCKLGSVKVPRLLGIEEHPGLFHLVSDVEGELRQECSWKDILERLIPAGSITGAPKSSATEVISRFEPYRGAYCGTLGWIHGGNAHFSVLIRTFFKDLRKDLDSTFFGTGAGITWGSVASDEWSETELKAERLIHLANAAMGIN